MPTYNRARFIVEAIDSLARQTRLPLEVIVVDDRSTDDTRALVQAHPLGPRLRYHLMPENRGASIARNTGVEMATGELIVFLDSDDILEPEHHATVSSILLSASDVGLVGCDCVMIDAEGQRLHDESWTAIQSRIKRRPLASGRRTLQEVFEFSTPFPGLTIRRDIYRRVGGLDQGLFPLDDYDLQLKVAASGAAVHYEHRPLARYRDHGGNESGPSKAVRVGRQKLLCLQRARERYGPARLGPRVTRRIGEVRLELSISLLRERRLGEGGLQLARSLVEDPGGTADLLRAARRRLGRVLGGKHSRVP
jgi:glycosyltransferase involved in cell wall biosynthesis